jgi:outer membrane protein OmpA-like peptidoglycan-associated protein
MRVRQFAIVESFNPGAIKQVILYDTRGKSHKVYEKKKYQSNYMMSRTFSKKIPFTEYKVVGLKVVLRTGSVKGYNLIDAIAISNNNARIKSKVNTLRYSEAVSKAENLGRQVNSRYIERLPIISPDGSTLYFARKNHPDNIINKRNEVKDDIWIAEKNYNGSWGAAKHGGSVLNNDLHNFVIAISPDNNYLYVASAYKNYKKDGVAVSKRKRGRWTEPKNLKIKNMYNRSRFAGYHVSMDGQILLMAVERDDTEGDRDLYVSFKQNDGDWTEPMNLGNVVNSVGMESSVFLAADNRTIYFSSNGFAGYGGLDMYMSRRLDNTWQNWSTPQNLGNEINTPGNDYNYTIPASGDYAYFSSDYMSYGQSDLFRIRLPKEARPDPVLLVDNEDDIIIDEELDGDLSNSDIAYNDDSPADPRLQNEVDALKEKLRQLNEELDDLEKEKNEPIVVREPRRQPTYQPKPRQPQPPKVDPEVERLKQKYNDRLTDEEDEEVVIAQPRKRKPTPRKPKKVDPELEKLKQKYNRLGDDEEVVINNDNDKNDEVVMAEPKKKKTPTPPKPPRKPKKDDELDDLRKKMLRLQGKETDENEEDNNDVAVVEKPKTKVEVSKPSTDKPNKPEKPTTSDVVSDDPFAPKPKPVMPDEPKVEPTQPSDIASDDPFSPQPKVEENQPTVDEEPEVDIEKLKEEIRQQLKEELRNDVKKELKKEMIGDVRDEVAEEVRVDLEDDLKKKVEDDLKKSLEDDVKDELKKDLKSDVEDKLKEDLKSDVKDDLRDELRDEVRDEVLKDLRDELAAEVRRELRRDMEYRLKKELEAQIRRELEDKIRKQLEEEYANKEKDNPSPAKPPKEDDVLIVPIKVGQIIPMNNIFFDANKTTLKDASFKELEKVVEFLVTHPNLIVEVGGHTNSWCSHDFANELSSGRAKIVQEFLVSKGISKTRIQFHGYGKTQPIADNKTVAGRKKNQRVEMKILEILE